MSDHNPILAACQFTEDGRTFHMQVEGGLHYIRGNTSPYFSLTQTTRRGSAVGPWDSCGAGHDAIKAQFGDRFADLAALHLSDIDGKPSHDEANAWYALAGALGGCGERFHAGTDDKLTRGECLDQFARHMRISLADATRIRDRLQVDIWAADEVRDRASGAIVKEYGPQIRFDYFGETLAREIKYARNDHDKRARRRLRFICDASKARWKREAVACIERHKLAVFGDADRWGQP